MTLAEYNDLLDTEPDFIETPTKELMEEWLDEKIEVQRTINEYLEKHNRYFSWGNLDVAEGDYQYSISVCGQQVDPFYREEMHIYSGIENIAKILGCELTERNRKGDREIPWEYHMNYKGYDLFEISSHRFSGFGDKE